MITSSEVEGGHRIPLDFLSVVHQLKNFVKATNYRCGDYNILEKSSMRYRREVNKRVNKKEDDHEDQKRKSRAGLVKVSRLSNTQASQSGHMLAWIMFHKISEMYRDMKHKETLQALLEI